MLVQMAKCVRRAVLGYSLWLASCPSLLYRLIALSLQLRAIMLIDCSAEALERDASHPVQRSPLQLCTRALTEWNGEDMGNFCSLTQCKGTQA